MKFNPTFFISIVLLVSALLFFVFTLIKTYENNKGFFKNLFIHLRRHLFLFVFVFPLVTLIFIDNADLSDKTYDFITKLCYGVVAVGFFSATMKYINSLYFVRKQFEDIIVSKKFDELIEAKFESFVFSDTFLASISEDELIAKWKKITFFKYRKKFPILWDKMNLKKYLVNHFFLNESLAYYYKGFRMKFDVELGSDGYLDISQKWDFTVVTNSKKPIELKFWVSNQTCPTEPKINKEKTIIDGVSLKERGGDNDKGYKEEKDGDSIKMIITLEGQKEYQVEQIIDVKQEFSKDKLRIFNTSKIIDDIFVEVKCSAELSYQFESLNGNVFSDDLMIDDSNGFKNKDIVMPGDVCMVSFFKN